jgi:hypothetical protein
LFPPPAIVPPEIDRFPQASPPTALIDIPEPILKSPEEDNKAGELDKAEEVLGVILPADEDATLPLYPSEETLDEPPSHITA